VKSFGALTSALIAVLGSSAILHAVRTSPPTASVVPANPSVTLSSHDAAAPMRR
jgi:hypothetical protein